MKENCGSAVERREGLAGDGEDDEQHLTGLRARVVGRGAHDAHDLAPGEDRGVEGGGFFGLAVEPETRPDGGHGGGPPIGGRTRCHRVGLPSRRVKDPSSAAEGRRAGRPAGAWPVRARGRGPRRGPRVPHPAGPRGSAGSPGAPAHRPARCPP